MMASVPGAGGPQLNEIQLQVVPPSSEVLSTRISIAEIADRLAIGRRTVYAMLEQRIIPGVRVGQRWLVTRHAYEVWEKTCSVRAPDACIEPGLTATAEVTVN
jgi:excisionase family DNA binding protein